MDNYTALEWLYKQLKKKRVALGNAESKPNVSSGEIADIQWSIETIEYIISVVLERGGNTPADVVEVVRCKDCKYYNIFALACLYPHRNGYIGTDGFCSYGERKEK